MGNVARAPLQAVLMRTSWELQVHPAGHGQPIIPWTRTPLTNPYSGPEEPSGPVAPGSAASLQDKAESGLITEVWHKSVATS
jgi:hypothetical protein